MLLTRPAKRADCRLFPAAHRGHAWPHTMLLTPGRGDHKNSQASLPMYMMSEGERQGSGLCVLPCVFPLPLSPAFTAAGTAKAGACKRARSGPLCRRCLHHRGQRTKPCEKAECKAAGKALQGGESQGEAVGGTKPFLRNQDCRQKGTLATSTGHCSSSAFLTSSQTILSDYTASQSQLPQHLPV